jgi:DNA-binding MarR family transcriptional regulator
VHLRDIRQFRRALRDFERLTSLQLKNCCSGVTLPQCLVLLETEEIGNPTVGRLAARLRLDNSTLSRTIDGLVGKGVLERIQDDRDRRAVRIRLTEAGRTLCREIHRENDAHCRRVFAKVPPAERSSVIREFERLVHAFLACETDSRCGGDTVRRKAASPGRRSSGRLTMRMEDRR